MDQLKKRHTGQDDIDTATLNRTHELVAVRINDTKHNSAMDDSIRILVSFKQSITRFGIASLLGSQSDFNVVGTTSNSSVCYQNALNFQPQVLLCDLDIANEYSVMRSDSDGCAFKMRANVLPHIAVIVVQKDISERKILQASKYGVRGYLTTNSRLEDLYRAIRVVHGGGTFLERHVQSRTVGMLGHQNDDVKFETYLLNNREQTILRLLAQGKRNQQIADIVYLSNSSVKRYLIGLYRKLGATNRADVVRIGISKGLI